jgi:hypothetical protein
LQKLFNPPNSVLAEQFKSALNAYISSHTDARYRVNEGEAAGVIGLDNSGF